MWQLNKNAESSFEQEVAELNRNRFLVFEVNGEFYAVNIQSIDEVMKFKEPKSLPLLSITFSV